MFEGHYLNPAQEAVAKHGILSSGFNCVLQLPTGSGKTWLAERAIEAALDSGQRAIYLTPLRALGRLEFPRVAKDALSCSRMIKLLSNRVEADVILENGSPYRPVTNPGSQTQYSEEGAPVATVDVSLGQLKQVDCDVASASVEYLPNPHFAQDDWAVLVA